MIKIKLNIIGLVKFFFFQNRKYFLSSYFYKIAFRAAVEGAHIHSIMCSYNAVNDVPSCGNNLFMNVVARGQWQFDGFIVSDCGAIADGAFTRYINEHYNGSADYQVRQGIVSGCDLK